MTQRKRTVRSCIICETVFTGNPDSLYCSICAKKRRVDNVNKHRICQDCGTEFIGGPRARRCPVCRAEAIRRKERKPTIRPLGSIDKCQRCGMEYIVAGGRQKYCPNCQREASLEWQRDHKRGYSQKPDQVTAKQERRESRKKICVYCLRTFWIDTPSSFCSDYCRQEQKKYQQCKADIKRGVNRNLKKYEEARERYRQNKREVL